MLQVLLLAPAALPSSLGVSLGDESLRILRAEALGAARARIDVEPALVIAPAFLLTQPGSGHGAYHGGGKMIERLFERLDLTDDQKEAVHNTMRDHRTETRQLREEKIATRRALGETIGGGVRVHLEGEDALS